MLDPATWTLLSSQSKAAAPRLMRAGIWLDVAWTPHSLQRRIAWQAAVARCQIEPVAARAIALIRAAAVDHEPAVALGRGGDFLRVQVRLLVGEQRIRHVERGISAEHVPQVRDVVQGEERVPARVGLALTVAADEGALEELDQR